MPHTLPQWRLAGALSAILILALPSLAYAQGSTVYQNGTVIPNHLAKFVTNGRIADGGGLLGDGGGIGLSPFSIYDNNSLGLCSDSAATTGPYNALCLGHDADSNGLITLDSYGGLAPKTLGFRINGATYPFPGTGNGDVLGPSPTKIGELATWNNLTGTLLVNQPKMVVVNSGGLTSLQVTDTTDTHWDIFGNAALVVATEGNQNGIVGSVINNTSGITYPTAVSGYARGQQAGGSVFGLYGQCDQIATSGVCTSEIDTSNYSGRGADGTLPPLSSFGTAAVVPIALQVGCGGNVTPGCSVGIHMVRNGRDPEPFITGIYFEPNAVTETGILIDATGVADDQGPRSYGIMVRTGNATAVPYSAQAMVTGSPTQAMFQILDAGGTPHFDITVGGDVVIGLAAALATNATYPFLYTSAGPGPETGVPNGTQPGRTPLYNDTTNHRLCWYEQPSSAWKCATGS